MAPVDNQSMALMLGEMRGQLRELVHQVANLAQKFEDVAKTVDGSKHIPGLISENKTEIETLKARVTKLETSESERRGAIGLSAWIFKTVPFAAFGGGLAAAWKVLGL